MAVAGWGCCAVPGRRVRNGRRVGRVIAARPPLLGRCCCYCCCWCEAAALLGDQSSWRFGSALQESLSSQFSATCLRWSEIASTVIASPRTDEPSQ